MKPVKARNVLNASKNICNVHFELQQAGRRRRDVIKLDQESTLELLLKR